MNDQKLQYEHQIKELESDMNNQKLQYEHQVKELETRSYIVYVYKIHSYVCDWINKNDTGTQILVSNFGNMYIKFDNDYPGF